MKCQIQWIDNNGNPTPDDDEAVCLAVIIQTDSGGRSNVREFPCCAKHARELDELVSAGLHHSPSTGSTSRWMRKELPDDAASSM